MKIPARFLCRRLTLPILVAGLALWSLTTAFAQKSDPVSPNEPKVTICHIPDDHIGFSITVGQSAVAAHLAHGDSLGACANEGSQVVCHRGSTITVTESALGSHLAHGDTLGPCNGFAGGGIKAASSAVGAPVASAPAALAAPRASVAPVVTTPVVQENVVICYKGQSVMVAPTAVQTYLSIGATMGGCPETSGASATGQK